MITGAYPHKSNAGNAIAMPSPKVVILAGGLGTRFSEETELRPKPMIEIGSRPILWHIMKIYSQFGLNDFIICVGYKGYVIKEFFANYHMHMADVTFDLLHHSTTFHRKRAEAWRVTLVETGEETMTGGRLRRARDYVGDEPFCMTYGDGLADLDLDRLLQCHRTSGRLATLTAVQQPGRWGVLDLDEASRVRSFREKADIDAGWINGGFMVLSPKIFDYIEGDDTVFEQDTLVRLSAEGQLGAFRHTGFWYAMDTLRDKRHLEGLWNSGAAPWKTW
jgi:glucose-1-phosphate cytidylyltransferase